MGITKETLAVNLNKETLIANKDRQTLMVVKPGFEHLVDEILLKVKEAGLQAAFWGKTTLTKEEASDFYYQDQGQPWHGRVSAYLVSGPISVFVVRGENALDGLLKVRDQIREEHALSRTQNVLHAPNFLEILDMNLNFFRRMFGSEPGPED